MQTKQFEENINLVRLAAGNGQMTYTQMQEFNLNMGLKNLAEDMYQLKTMVSSLQAEVASLKTQVGRIGA